MKRLAILLTLIFVSIVHAVYACPRPHHYDFSTPYYSGCYDATHKVPHYVDWVLTKRMVENNTDIRVSSGFSWKADGGVLEKKLRDFGEEVLHDSDYTYTGFDRGHIAPNEDFDDTIETSASTFFMGNVAPQYPRFNRPGGLWYESELWEREYAVKYGEIRIVVTITEFEGSWTGAKVKMAVPSYFTKAITWDGGGVTWRLPNVMDGGGRQLQSHEIASVNVSSWYTPQSKSVGRSVVDSDSISPALMGARQDLYPTGIMDTDPRVYR